MKEPDIIYLQTCGDCMNWDNCPEECLECDFSELGEVTWCDDKINDSDKLYFSEGVLLNVIATVLLSSGRFYTDEVDKLADIMVDKIVAMKGGHR